MLIAALLCLAVPALADMSGEWVFTRASLQGASISADLLGIDGSLILNEDGTASYCFAAEALTGLTWTETDTHVLLHQGNATPLALKKQDDGTLAVSDAEMLYVFAREQSAQKGGFTINERAEMSDFLGSWHATGVTNGGLYTSLTADALDLHVRVEGDTAAIRFGSDSEISAACSFEDGKLLVADGEGTVTFQLCDNGDICFSLTSDDGYEAVYYLSKDE